MIKYNIYNKGNKELFEKIQSEFNVSEVISRILVNRDIPLDDIEDFIHPDIKKLYNPYLLTDVKEGALFTKNAIEKKAKIRVIGDYDIDGIMSTYILVTGLRCLGVDCDYQIPHRIEDGYGLNANIIRHAIDDGIDLIVTCDNGVSAIDEIKLARDNGIDVVVTDHHELLHEDDGRELRPEANFLINPKRAGDKYPFKSICGATVAWKFMTVLFAESGIIPEMNPDGNYMELRDEPSEDYAESEKLRPIMSYLEFVAFATIGDVMELTGENRPIVKYGLKALKDTDNIGFRLLIDNRLGNVDSVTTYHVGFVLGPCINASGRLDTAAKSLELLLEEDEKRAAELTHELTELNEERKAMTEEGVDKAFSIIEEEMTDDKVLVIYMPDIHESVAGIVAGRIRERCCKPTIVLCDGEECVKGSGRSIEAYNMYEALHEVQDLFIKFGGHPMAAGMSLDRENVNALRERLNGNCSLTEEDFADIRIIDMTLNPEYITPELIEELELLEPFGNGNKKPIFAKKNAKIHSMRKIAEDKYFKFEFEIGTGTITGLYFQDASELEEKIIAKFGIDEYNKALRGKANNLAVTIMFYPQINEFRGVSSVQIVLSDVIIQ